MTNPSLLHVLARALVGGEQTKDDVVARAIRTLGRPWRWLPALCHRYLQEFKTGTRPRHSAVVDFLHNDAVLSKHLHKLEVANWMNAAPFMQPVPAALNWDLPVIETPGALADWLAVQPQQLDWFADLKALGYKHQNKILRHYRYRVVEKPSGGVRLIESPKPRLKALQRKILSDILNRIPLHESVHGFRAGHSIQSFAAPHSGQNVVLKMDLRNFFPSISGARIQTFFRTAGYPEAVADLLGGICTNATPRDIWHRFPGPMAAEYARPHLPQGAPTSPVLANLCAYKLDRRLAGLAKSASAHYTRYADDLAFSGDAGFARHSKNFAAHVTVIAQEERFGVQHHKTRIMHQCVAQHLAGLTVNEHANIPRAEFDRLKATLTNCIRQGARSQNLDGHLDFRSHLQGRVAFVEMINPAKGARLRNLLTQVKWD